MAQSDEEAAAPLNSKLGSMIVGRQLRADVEDAGSDADEVTLEGSGVEVTWTTEELAVLDGIAEGSVEVVWAIEESVVVDGMGEGGVEVAWTMEELDVLDGIELGGSEVTSFGSTTRIVTSSISIPALAACLLNTAIAGQLTLSVSVGLRVLALAL
jgi:hypothetical protein